MPAPSFAHLLGAIASWFLFWGMSQVLFQWLVTDYLASPPALVGAAQMSFMLPSLFFLLLGGAVADRLDPRRLLLAVHLAASVVAWVLWALVIQDALTYAWLIGYALAIGTLQAFGMPARDTQLSDVVQHEDLSRSVAGLTMVQHIAQMSGAFVAGTASLIGSGWVLAAQATVLLLGAFPVSRLPGRPTRAAVAPRSIEVREIRAGLVEVFHSPILRPVFLLAVSIGTFFIGPFLVLLPLLVRDVYRGGAAEMGTLTAMFPLGAVLGGAVIVWRGGIERNGRALALGQLLGAASIASIASGLPFPGTVASVLMWGVAGALFINTGRTLFQKNASGAHRGRVLSVYTLGLLGASPLGSFLAGALAEPLGLHGALAFAAAGAAVVVLTMITTTRLWSLR